MGRPTAVVSGSSLCSGVAPQVPWSRMWSGLKNLPSFPCFMEGGSLPALTALALLLAAERGEEQSRW